MPKYLRAAAVALRLAFFGLLAASPAAFAPGCRALHPIDGVPADTLDDEYFHPVRSEREVIDPSLLGQPRVRQYRLDAGDLLGVTVDGLLGYEADYIPPVQTSNGADFTPGLGFPIEVAPDGEIALPRLGRVSVRGLTKEEAEEAIRRAYVDTDLVKEEAAREANIFVTVLRRRVYRVVVFREEGGPDAAVDNSNAGQGGARFGPSSGEIVELPAYRNDVLHALAATGGLPNYEAENTVIVARAGAAGFGGFPPGLAAPGATPGHSTVPGPTPPAGTPGFVGPPAEWEGPHVTRIPLRLHPGCAPPFGPADVILRDGDAVYVPGRSDEVFYTGGLLGPGQFRLPRDQSLDVIEALAVVQGQRRPLGVTRSLTGQSALSRDVTANASSLLILRELPNDAKLRIEVDLRDALTDPRQRPIVQPGDYLVLQYRKPEAVAAFFERFFIEGIVLGIASSLTFGDN